MTAREVIRRNLERDNPHRIGMDLDRGRMNDFCLAGFSPSETWQQQRWVDGDVEYYTDEWGNICHRSVHGCRGGEIYRPAIDDWARLKDYQLPDIDNPKRLDDLAEAGICCMQFDQPALYGLERVSAKLRELGMCIYSPVDIQKVLPTGDRRLIEHTAHRMVQLFRGGFIANNDRDLKGIGAQPEWDEWAYQVFLRYASD